MHGSKNRLKKNLNIGTGGLGLGGIIKIHIMEKHGHQPKNKLDTSNPPGKEKLNNPRVFPTYSDCRDLELPVDINSHYLEEVAEGMTLLDYFAAKAMQGLVTSNRAMGSANETAEWAYQLAEAMLIERQKHI